jgi:hypothetical protein
MSLGGLISVNSLPIALVDIATTEGGIMRKSKGFKELSMNWKNAPCATGQAAE